MILNNLCDSAPYKLTWRELLTSAGKNQKKRLELNSLFTVKKPEWLRISSGMGPPLTADSSRASSVKPVSISGVRISLVPTSPATGIGFRLTWGLLRWYGDRSNLAEPGATPHASKIINDVAVHILMQILNIW